MNTREEWLEAAIEAYRPWFSQMASVKLPEDIKISTGWSKGAKKNQRGWTWKSECAEGISNIFISPEINDPVDVLAILAHELVHVYDDCKSGHKGEFVRVAKLIGLEPKWTGSNPSEMLVDMIKIMLMELGDYPHTKLTPASHIVKKQGTYMLKLICTMDDYTVRTTRKHLDDMGCPTCPCGHVMVEENPITETFLLDELRGILK